MSGSNRFSGGSSSSKRRLGSSSPSQGSKKSRKDSWSEQPLKLQEALSDEFPSCSSSAEGKKVSEKNCSLCASCRHLLRVEEGVHFRVNQAIDVELYLNSVLYKNDKRSVPKPILLCPQCFIIVKKYIDQKSRIASLEASKGLDDPIIAGRLKKLSEVESMVKALNSQVVVKIRRLEEESLKLPKRRGSTLGAPRRATLAKGTNTEPSSQEGGHTVETYEVLLHERDKDMAQLDRVLKSTIKVKDMAIDAQNLLKFKNSQLETKIKCLEKVSHISEKERSMIDMVSKMTDNMDTVKSENESLTSELKELKGQLDESLKNVLLSAEVKTKLSQELIEAKEVIVKNDAEILRKANEIESLSQEIVQAKNEIQRQAESCSVPAKDLEVLKEDLSKKEGDIKTLKQELSEKDGELTEKAKRLVKYKFENTKLEKRLQEFEKVFGDSSSSGDFSKTKITERIAEQDKTILKLRVDLVSQSKELQSNEIDNAESLSLLNSELQELKKELHVKSKKVRDLESSSAQLESTLQKSEVERKQLVSALLRDLGKSQVPSTQEVNINNNLPDEVHFNSSNAKQFFGEGISQLSEAQLDKSLFFVNALVKRTFSASPLSLRKGGSSTDKAVLKKLFDEKMENFSKTLQTEGLGSHLIYTLFTEAFLTFFGKLPEGVSRRKLRSGDKLLSTLPNRSEATEIMATTPILIDILETPGSSTGSSSVPSSSSSSQPPPRPFLKVRTNLLASTAAGMAMSSNTISQAHVSMPSLPTTSVGHPSLPQVPLPPRFLVQSQRPQILVNQVVSSSNGAHYGNQLSVAAKNLSLL